MGCFRLIAVVDPLSLDIRNRCLWRALHKQRYAQHAVMHSWSGSAASPPSQEGCGRVFELHVITRS